MLLKQLVIIISSCCLVACASSMESGGSAADEESSRANDCIHKPSVRGYTVLDEQNLIVEASARRTYHVVLKRRAHGLRHSHRIWFNTTTSRVCAGFDSIGHDGTGEDGLRIASIRQLLPEEEEHLLIRYGKKEPEIKQSPAPQEVEGAEVEELDEAASE